MASPSIVPITQQVADLRGLIALTTGKEQESYKQELADLLRAPATAGELYAAGVISKDERDSRSLDSDIKSPASTELYAAGLASRPSTVARYAAGQISKAERDFRLRGGYVEAPEGGDTFITDPYQVERLTKAKGSDNIRDTQRAEAANHPLTAAAVGAADASSFGLVNHALRAIAKQNPEALAILKEANPTATSLGEAGGHLVTGYGAGGVAGKATGAGLRALGTSRAALTPLTRVALAGAEGAGTGAAYSAAQAAGHGSPADQVALAATDAVTDPLQLAMNVAVPVAFQGAAEGLRSGVKAARRPGNTYAEINANRELETPAMRDIEGWELDGDMGTTAVAQDQASKMADVLADEMAQNKADYHTAEGAIEGGPGRVTVPYENLHQNVASGLRRSDADPSVFMSNDALAALEDFKRKTTGSVPGQPPGEPAGWVDYDPESIRSVVDAKYVDVEVSPKEPAQQTAYAQAEPASPAPAAPSRKPDITLIDDTVMQAKDLAQLRKHPESGTPGAVDRTAALVDKLKSKMTPEELAMFEDHLTNPGAIIGRPAASAPEGVVNRGQRHRPVDPGPIMYEPTEPEVVGKAAVPAEVSRPGTPVERAILDKIHLWSIRVKKGDKTSLNNLRDLATQLSQSWKDPNITSAQKANTRALYAGVMDAIKGWPGAVEKAVTPKVSGTAATEMLTPRTVDEAIRARRLTQEAQEAVDLDAAMREDYAKRARDSVIDQQLAFKRPLSKWRSAAEQPKEKQPNPLVEEMATESSQLETPEEMARVGESGLDSVPDDFNPDVLRNFDRTLFKEQVGEFYSKAGVPGRLFAKYNSRFNELAKRRPDLAPYINAIRAKTAKELSKFSLSKNGRLATNSASIGRGIISHNLDWLILTGTRKNGWMEKAINYLEKAGPQVLRAPGAEYARKRKDK